MSGENINSNSGNNAPNSDAEKWESLYKDLEKKINDNFIDNQEFIEHKAKKPIEYSKEDANRDLEDAKAKRDEELKQINDLKTELERTENRSEEEYNKEHNEDFVGETNTNSKTGKERTFNDLDSYAKESGDKRKRRHDLAVLSEYVTRLPDENAEGYSKRITELYEDFPRKDGESLEAYKKRIDEANKNNEIYEN